MLHLIYAAFGNPTLGYLRYLRSVESGSAEELQLLQDEKLRQETDVPALREEREKGTECTQPCNRHELLLDRHPSCRRMQP